jgi:hypothetical protein
MRKNFDMDAAIRRALRESIEAHAHEWEPKFNTGVGPVGDDAPFDKKVSGDVNEGKDCEDCCPKCGKCPCECDKVNEGTIPGDSHEWEPGFETGVGEVGDDSPFTQAVNESLTDTNDWEDGSFGASNHRKEGIAFADGADECGNGVVATSQKNSGEVVSKDNLSEGEDEESQDEWGEKTRFRMQQAGDKLKNFGSKLLGGAKGLVMGGNGNAAKIEANNSTIAANQKAASAQDERSKAAVEKSNAAYDKKIQELQGQVSGLTSQIQALEGQKEAKAKEIAGWYSGAKSGNTENVKTAQGKKLSAQQKAREYNGFDVQPAQPVQESVESENDIIAEERDRFFDIINRIEKLYD